MLLNFHICKKFNVVFSNHYLMQTIISQDVEKSVTFLKNGEVIGVPTETVYGLAALCSKPDAIANIFKIKNRPQTNPLIVHIGTFETLSKVCTSFPEKAKILADKFWPGPLTLLLPKSEFISDQITAGSNLVAVRMPNHPVALELLRILNEPFVAPSANPANAISPTSSAHVFEYFNGKIPMILEGGVCEKGIESTIVGFENNEVIIHRLGSLSKEAIEQEIGSVQLKNQPKDKIVSPGQFSKHYSPNTPLVLTNQIENTLRLFPNKKVGLLLFNDLNFPISETIIIKKLTENGDLDLAMKQVYEALHQLDKMNLDLIIAEHLPDVSVGTSVNDRLKRAAGTHYIY